ncbi:MAG: hypothetical protein R3F59_28045 [Myxococcota bacterium]
MMRTWAWLLLTACNGPSETATEAPEPQAQAPAAETPEVPSSGQAAEILAQASGLPADAANARLLKEVAAHYGVGLVKCPLPGNGRVREIYGTGRDQLLVFGPTWEMEWDASAAPPWDPVFDEVLAEDNWVTMLAVPGQTRGWIATRTDTYAYEFPPVKAGETTLCTGVHVVKPRVVRGTIDGETAPENVIVPCAMDLPQVASDNTFVVELPVPCEMWVEGGPSRSQKVRVDEGEEPVDLELTMKRDPLLQENRFWSEAGRDKVAETLDQVEARQQATSVFLDELAEKFADDAMVMSNVKRHRYEMQTRTHKIEQTRVGLEEQRRGKVPAMSP